MLDTKTLNEVAAVGSKLKKEELLGGLNEDSLKFLRWALDPAITFGVTVEAGHHEGEWLRTIRAAVLPDKGMRDRWWNSLDKLCSQLSRRDLTGNAAAEAIDDIMLGAPDVDSVTWATRILNKDLRAGFSVSTLNKAHPDCIEPFAVALAKPFEPEKHEIRGAWCVEPKLDGLRMVVIGGQALTRNGRVIESVGHILEVLAPFGGLVFDGEIMGETEFNEDSGKIRKKGEGPNLELKYNIFDCIPLDEWTSRKTRPFKARRQLLRDNMFALGKSEFVVAVESRDLPADVSAEDLSKLRDHFIKQGYEGAMVKSLEAPYVFKRSDNILKLKELHTTDGYIRSWFEGKGRLKGMLGGFYVDFDGVETKVGGGFSDEQRKKIWEVCGDGITDYIDRCVEVEFQNKTPDGKLRNPVFIKFRPDKDR